MNVSRLVASVGGYIYGLADTEVAVHLYGGSGTTLSVAGGRVTLHETSNYPWDGHIRVEVAPEGAGPFTLSLRIPGWSRGATAQVNGEAMPVAPERGYLRITRAWTPGDVVELDLPMPAERLHAHPDVRQDAGRVALRRGPLVYCAEERDQDVPLHRLRLDNGAPLLARHEPALLGGITVIEGAAQAAEAGAWGSALYRTEPAPERPATLIGVPYYAWANRGPNPMQVWLRQ